jgi:hypothetical protein
VEDEEVYVRRVIRNRQVAGFGFLEGDALGNARPSAPCDQWAWMRTDWPTVSPSRLAAFP